jgi:hypothetical protein
MGKSKCGASCGKTFQLDYTYEASKPGVKDSPADSTAQTPLNQSQKVVLRRLGRLPALSQPRQNGHRQSQHPENRTKKSRFQNSNQTPRPTNHLFFKEHSNARHRHRSFHQSRRFQFTMHALKP